MTGLHDQVVLPQLTVYVSPLKVTACDSKIWQSCYTVLKHGLLSKRREANSSPLTAGVSAG